MSRLLSDSAMAALRGVAELGMTTDVLIYDLVNSETATGSTSTWVPRSSTVKGWLHSQVTPMLTVVSGHQTVVNTYRLFVPIGTVITPGDRVVIGGDRYIVSDTTGESTWQAMLTVSLRKAD